MKMHGEIIYVNSEGMNIHSDICPPNCKFSNITEEHKKFYHESLDEWLNKSNGTGIFYLKQEEFEDYGD
jgi:hypothetical protein